MTKDSRKASVWTNQDIAEDASGYLEAQAAEREDARKAQERRAEDLAREDYVKSYVFHGGDESDANAAFVASRSQQAAGIAAQEDEAARRVHMAETMRRL